MKLTKKEIDGIICQVAGEDVLPLVKALKNRKNVSEFKLAESIKKEINLTRNMLYRLYDHNLVSFIRKKDKKKGWYIYYWTFNGTKIKDVIKNLKKNRLDNLKERLQRENSSQFYSCKHNCIRLDFEQSTDFEFKCPECGVLLNLEDNVKKKKDIQKEINRLQKELTIKKITS